MFLFEVNIFVATSTLNIFFCRRGEKDIRSVSFGEVRTF